jgi:deoxyribodipyrimidine photolyase-related protein
LDLSALPATLRDAEALWQWALESCLPHFGPYQDAMSDASRTLFHTRISPLVNIHRLLPARVVADAEAAEAPLASREGFIRQVIGWREFVRHVHELTDGFRERVDGKPSIAITPGDGGYARWADRPWLHQAGDSAGADEPDGGAAPSHLGSDQPLPVAWWGVPSGLRCLDESVKAVWDEAYGHHIARLMVLANLATLLDVSPRELTDWFWIAYADAYDWVVEPNVLGMGTYAVGPLMTTKPYVSGAAYIDRMSDHCRACAFHPKKTCPITPMYWDFLRRHREQLQENPRLKMPYRSLAKRSGEQQRRDRDLARAAAEALRAGRTLSPDAL